MEPIRQAPTTGFSFVRGLLFELALLALAAVAAWLFHLPLLEIHRLDPGILIIGSISAMPPCLFFLRAIRSRTPALAPHRRLLEHWLRPLFSGWSLPQLFLISVAAGVSEEALFRGIIQGGLAERLGIHPALILASLAFGAAHFLTWTYAVFASLMGVYLGLLWILTGSLLAPIVTHALYDFIALVYLLRLHRPTS
jgi:uncharacterized protein